MKRLALTAHWLYAQLYVTFAIIFYSKKRLRRIAFSGENQTLMVIGRARWIRVWLLSIVGIAFWLFWFWPYFNFRLFLDTTTWYSNLIYTTDMVIFFDKYTISYPRYWLYGVFSGGLLQLLELWSDHKAQYFKQFISPLQTT